MEAPVSMYRSAEDNDLTPDQLTHLWKNLFDSSQDAQIICRADGMVEKVNPRAIRLLRLNSPEEKVGSAIFNLLRPPADQKVREILQRRRPQPEVLYSMSLGVAGDISGPIDLEITPLDHGRFLVVFKDASRRLRLESHVRRLVTAIDSTPEVFFITDADLRISFVNPAFQVDTGYSIEEVLGRPDEFLRAPDQSDKIQKYLDAVREAREWIGELTNARRDGTTYQVEATISPIFDMSGVFMGYVACERDITERLRLEKELRLDSDFIHSILTSLDSAIYTVNRDFRLTHANEGWRQLAEEHGGIRPGGAPELGRLLLDYVPDPARRTELDRLFREVLASGKAQESQYVSPDERRWLLKVFPWIHAGEVRGLICSVSDQTHYYQLQSQLFQSQKMEIIGTLAAGVAHDFNNLLQAIRGNISLVLLQSHENPGLHHCAEQVSVAASRAAEITQQLLTFSRTAEERDAILDLNEVVHEAGQLARRTLRGNVSLELIRSGEPIPIKVDPTRANQALLNLCVNAQDAMPQGGRLTITNTTVQLTAEQISRQALNPEQEFACCNISDTGCGIPQDLIDRVFEPFFTTKEKGKGTGLGLPIVQRVLKEAGGFIEVDSVPGHGTTFHLYFPIVREALTSAPENDDKQLAQGSGRVLVVDDLDLLRDFTRSFLEAAGFTVSVASSGAEALKVLDETAEPVDLLFTDYSMPGMNGIELIDCVVAKWPKMKLILASGYFDETARTRLDELRVSVLCKPYDMREAAELIIGLLAQREG
ncbi:MAG: PAS domain S-box protein [Akkermansiaceae bacterium]|nr:PAS domain S-box protein [Verrucomicrobiales bacterium]